MLHAKKLAAAMLIVLTINSGVGPTITPSVKASPTWLCVFPPLQHLLCTP